MDTEWLRESIHDPDAEALTNSSRDALLLKCKSAIEVLNQDLDQERRTRVSAERKMVNLRRDLMSVEEELELLKRRDESYAAEVESEVKEKSQLKKRIAILEDNLSVVTEEKDDLSMKYQTLLGELHAAQNMLERARSELSEKQEAMTDWGETVSAVESKLQALSSENDQLKADREKIFGNCEKLLQKNEELEEKWKSAKVESHDFAQKLEKLREQHMDKVTEVEREKAKQHQNLTENFSQKTLQYHEEMQREMREQKSAAEAAGREVARLVDENGKLTQQTVSLNLQLEKAKQDLKAVLEERNGLETENRKGKNALEVVHLEYRRELEIKEKLYNGAVSRLEEEIRGHEQTRHRVEELAGKLAQQESASSSAISEWERQLDDLTSDLHRKASEIESYQSKFAQLQRDANDTITKLKNEHLHSLQQYQQDADRAKSETVENLQAQIKLVESQRDSDHENYQIEMLKLKDQYTQALISNGEELKELRSERNRSRGTINELERRISSLTDRMQARTQEPGKRAPNLQFPLDRQRQPWTSEETDSPKEGDGIKFLGQLRDLTSKLERSLPTSKFS